MRIVEMDLRGDTCCYAGTIIVDILKLLTSEQVIAYVSQHGWVKSKASNNWEQVYIKPDPEDTGYPFALQIPGKTARQDNPVGLMSVIETIAIEQETTFLAVVCQILGKDHLELWPESPREKLLDVQQALLQLSQLDEAIRQNSQKQHLPDAYDPFMSLVHTKEGLRDYIKKQTGQEPYWTENGYELR